MCYGWAEDRLGVGRRRFWTVIRSATGATVESTELRKTHRSYVARTTNDGKYVRSVILPTCTDNRCTLSELDYQNYTFFVSILRWTIHRTYSVTDRFIVVLLNRFWRTGVVLLLRFSDFPNHWHNRDRARSKLRVHTHRCRRLHVVYSTIKISRAPRKLHRNAHRVVQHSRRVDSEADEKKNVLFWGNFFFPVVNHGAMITIDWQKKRNTGTRTDRSVPYDPRTQGSDRCLYRRLLLPSPRRRRLRWRWRRHRRRRCSRPRSDHRTNRRFFFFLSLRNRHVGTYLWRVIHFWWVRFFYLVNICGS